MFDSKPFVARACVSKASEETHSRRYRIAGAYAQTIIHECFGSAGDFKLWAWYCYNFDREAIKEKAIELAKASRDGKVKRAPAVFQHWLIKKFGAKPSCI